MASQNIFYSVFLWLAEHWYVVKTHKTFLNLRNVLEMMLFFLKVFTIYETITWTKMKI
jgi:hypothetical protein